MPATIDAKYIKKSWNRTSSTGKELLKLVKPIEKLEDTLAKGESRSAWSDLSGALKVFDAALSKAEKTYKEKKDKKMSEHTAGLQEAVRKRGREVREGQKSYLDRLQLWESSRKDLIAFLEKEEKTFSTWASEAASCVSESEKAQKESQSLSAASDPASAIQLEGQVDTLEEQVEGLKSRIDAAYEEVKRQIGPIRQQTPDSTGIQLAKKDVKPFAKLWKNVMKLQVGLGDLQSDVSDALEQVTANKEAVHLQVSDNEDRVKGFVKLLEKTGAATDSKLGSLDARFVSKYPGYRRNHEDWAGGALQAAVDGGDQGLVDGIQKGRGLQRDQVKSTRKALGKALLTQKKALDKALGRVPDALSSNEEIGAQLRRYDALRERADALLKSADTDIAAIKDAHRTLERILPL